MKVYPLFRKRPAQKKRNVDSSTGASSSSKKAKSDQQEISWVRDESFPRYEPYAGKINAFLSSEDETYRLFLSDDSILNDAKKLIDIKFHRNNFHGIEATDPLGRIKGKRNASVLLTKIPSGPPAPSPLGPSPSGPPAPSLLGPSAPLSHTKESCKDLEELSYLDASEKPLEDPFWDALEQPSDDEAGTLEQPSDDGAGFLSGPVPSPPTASPAQQPIVEDVFEKETVQETFPDAEELFPDFSATTNASPPPSSPSPPAPSSPSPTTNASSPPSSPRFWDTVKGRANRILEKFTTTVCEIASGIAEIPKRYQQYQERLAEEAWNIVEEVFKRGVENHRDIVGSIWDDLQEAAVMYPPVKQGFLSYFRSGIIDLEKPGRLLVSIWHYVPISSSSFSGFCMKIVLAGLMFSSPTFWLHYQCFFAVFLVAGVCQQCIEHCPLFNTAKTEMVPGRHDTRTYDEKGGDKMRKEATCDTIPGTPMDWKGSKADWKKVMLAYRAAIPMFYWLLAEEFKFELLMIGYGNHVKYYVLAFFGDLLQHARVHFESCMHTAAFFYFPRADAIDHFVRVYVKSILFLKGEDWKDEAAVERDYHRVRDYFSFADFTMIPCECIQLKDDETHQDGATFVLYSSITALAKFLGTTPSNVQKHLARLDSYRGVIKRGDETFFVRTVESNEDFPRLCKHIKYETVVVQEVELSWVTGEGKLTKIGEMKSFPYVAKAASFLVEENGEECTSANRKKYEKAIRRRIHEKEDMSTKDTIPPRKDPKWIVGRSFEEVEFNIEDVVFELSQRKVANRVR
ncbi:predicted protein [Chaetoceros tenuissimus]|uniref:Uncharacterized protein n=1 Tax=Chaetoceros tenuissimus TaxID=426638 RepID=A0AAD3CGF3_9STRA|nr:predicted protein [Chaetoceros tenuissimus]